MRDIRELVTSAKCCSDFVTELALEHGRHESWFCAVTAGDAVSGSRTYQLVFAASFRAVCLLCINPFVSCFCAYMVSLPTQCALLTALSVRGLEESSGGLSTI